MGVFDNLLKLNHMAKIKKPLDSMYYYWDTRQGKFLFIDDIINSFDSFYVISDRNLQQDIIKFLAPNNFEQSLRLISILASKSTIPNNFFKSSTELFRDIQVLEQSIPFTDPESRTQILNSQYDISFESHSEVVIITKNICWSLIYETLDLPKNITITHMKYRNNWRFSTARKYFVKRKDFEEDTLQIEFELNSSRLACICYSRNYLTTFKFISISFELQNELIDLFTKFHIIAETKRNIHIKFIPRPSINKSLLIPLRDVIMTGSLSRYLITMELDKILETKKRSSFLFAGVKILIPKSDVNDEISFNISDKKIKITYLDGLYFYHFFENFMEEFYQNKTSIIELYEKNIKSLSIIEAKRVKLTKKLIDSLRQAEPTIFAEVYTQDCQYQRQPYIVKSLDEFEKRINLLMNGKKKVADFLEKKSQEVKKKITLKDLLLEFPTPEFQSYYPEASKRFYACIGRENIDYNKYPFPLVQKKEEAFVYKSEKISENICEFFKKRENIKDEIRGAPCCFQKLHEEKKTISTSHILTNLKNVPPERIGFIQNYLASFIDPKYYRYGIDGFKSLVERIKPDEFRGLIENQDFNYFNFELTDESLHFLSFYLNINIVVYETIFKFNSLIFKIVPSIINSSQDNFIFFTRNTSGTYEQIKTKTKSIHGVNDTIVNYAQTYFKILENEKLRNDR